VHRAAVFLIFTATLLPDTIPAGQTAPGKWTLNCGLWRTDNGFTSLIEVKNRLVTAPVSITPVLFMADGTEYDLPPVNIAAAGVATINVNNALASAPANVAGHLSQFGSATLTFTGNLPAVIAQTALGSPSRSLSYVARFTGITQGNPSQQTLEGLWWAYEADVGGFVYLSNASSGVRNVSVQVVTGSGQSQAAQSLTLAPRSSQALDLVAMVGRQLNAGGAGGLRVQYMGLPGEINVVGGLESQEGYSATMPFWMPPMASMAASPVTLGHPGLMVGTPNPGMGFRAGTSFSPYLALRNLTEQVVAVSLTLYTEQGKSLQAPSQSLQPFESRQVDLVSVLQGLGLKDLNGMLTLAVTHTGQPNDVIVAAGSVDGSGTYVFEVEGRMVEQGLSKDSPYWTVRNGSDTMVSVWNPTPNPQEIIATMYYGDSSGHYRFHFHLAPHATANLDVKELMADGSADDEGNYLTSVKQEGSFAFDNAADAHGPTTLNVSVGIYNVVKGMCTYGTIYCGGYSGINISPTSATIPNIGGSQTFTVTGKYYDGTTPNVTGQATFSSSNSSVVSASGSQAIAKGVGTATVTASASLPLSGSYSGYNPTCATLQQNQNFLAQASVTVKVPCFAQLKYRPVYVLDYYSGNHSFWWFQDSNNKHWVADGGPGGTCPFCGYLVDWVVSGDVGHYPADNSGASLAWGSGTSTSVCTQVTNLYNYAVNFPQTTYSYAMGSSPNSNTFAHWAGNAAPFSITTPPPNATGW
jgi:hypothetical protein